MALKESLNSFNNLLASINHPSNMMFNEGVDKQYIDVLFISQNIDLKRNEDLYTLYSWRNGIKMSEDASIGEMTLFSDGIFISIEEALTSYRHYVFDTGRWDKKLFPLFTSGGGDFLLIDMEPTSSTYNMIHFYSPTILLSVETVTIYDSLDNLFVSVLACYKEGVYYIDNNLFESNGEDGDIFLKLNPLSEYWRLE
jgi:hypothetical protein